MPSYKWLDVKHASSTWTCCCWQEPPRSTQELKEILWREQIKQIRDISHTDEWCHCATFTAAMQFDSHLYSWMTQASKQGVFKSVSSSSDEAVCVLHGHASRGFTEDSGHSSLWTWKGSSVDAASTSRPPFWRRPQQHGKPWRLPVIHMLLWLWCSETLKMVFVSLTFGWLNAWSLKKHLTHPDESQVR